MNFLSPQNFADHLRQLWDDDDFTIEIREQVSVDWNFWSDAGNYPNDLADRPLAPGPWYISAVRGSVAVSFPVAKAWAAVINGEPSFKFDDEGPCGVTTFLEECEALHEDLCAAVVECVREHMNRPEEPGEADEPQAGGAKGRLQ